MEEYSLNKEFLLEMLLQQLQTSGDTIEDCTSMEEVNALADKLLNTGNNIENIAKDSIDNDEVTEEFMGSYLGKLFATCTDISTRLIIKSLELSGELNDE